MLYVKSRNGTELVFEKDSDTVLVNGVKHKLAKPLQFRDGLPVMPLKFLYKNAGIEYSESGKRIDAYAISKERFDIVSARKPFEFEFEIPADSEGFKPAGMTMAVYGGRLHGTALIRDNVVQPYDAMLTYNEINIDASKCTKAVVGMKHYNTPESSSMEMFFLTDTDEVWNQNKSARASIYGTSSNGIVEYTLDFSSNNRWTGTITDIRLDPVSRSGSFEIDYVRFIFE